MEELVKFENNLHVYWTRNHCHIKEKEYIETAIGFHGPGVTYEQGLENERKWNELSNLEKIACVNVFALRIKPLTFKDSRLIDPIYKQLLNLCEVDPTACLQTIYPTYQTFKILKDEFSSHLYNAEAEFRQKLDRYNKLKNKFLIALKGHDLYDGSDIQDLNFSCPKIKTSPEWYRDEVRVVNFESLTLIFQRDSPTFKLFEQNGWIEKYSPWNTPLSRLV
jgi:hypothetical protein